VYSLRSMEGSFGYCKVSDKAVWCCIEPEGICELSGLYGSMYVVIITGVVIG